jgi:ferric-dicitrate binding protein FerR (iron transport regulator)
MSSSTSSALPESETGHARRRRSRLQALAILAVCAAPTVAALVAYYGWQPHDRTNYGELIEARPVPAVRLERLDGKPFAFDALKGKWIMVQVDEGRCDSRCQAKLFAMRQVRIAQGREMDRVARVWLVLDGEPMAETRLTEGVILARASAAQAAALFPAAGEVRDHIYLIDPLGNVMLRFPAEADAKGMMRDVARLLKVSRIG